MAEVMKSSCWSEWQPVSVMVAIDFALAILNVLLKKVVDGGTNHLVIITYRTSISAVFLAPIAYFLERKTRPKLTSGILCQLFISAMVGATLTQYAFLLGIDYTSATFACAFINMVPAVTFLMALPFGIKMYGYSDFFSTVGCISQLVIYLSLQDLNELETVDMKSKSGGAKVMGTIISVCGAMVLTLYKGMLLTHNHSHYSKPPLSHHLMNHVSLLSSDQKTERWTVGTIALVAGMLLWSSWFLIQAKISKSYPCQYSSTAFMCFFSALQSAAMSLAVHRDISVWVLKGKLEILTVVYAGVVGSGLCFVGMSWAVKKRGPLFTAAFSPLIQIIVAMFDFTILHEQLHLGSVLGSILVIVGLYILLWGKSKEVKISVMPKQVEGANDHGEEDRPPSP